MAVEFLEREHDRLERLDDAGEVFKNLADTLFERVVLARADHAGFAQFQAAGVVHFQHAVAAELQARINAGQMAKATQRMLDTTWSITTMPELAQLAFSALQFYATNGSLHLPQEKIA